MTICTAVTKSHLAGARALARSMKAVHPDAQVYVLLADRVDGCFDPAAEPFHTILLDDLPQRDTIAQMAFYYNPFEFCCAVRPLLHQYLWQKTAAASWVFLDSDILVVGDMSNIFRSLETASVLLNPHSTSPVPPEFFRQLELGELEVGLYNGGFVGVRRCEPAMAFINWFRSRLRLFCFHDVAGQFVDQLWLTHVPVYFRDVLIYTHPGANLAHWNLFKTTLTKDANGKILADGQTLMFAHFSGWQFDDPTSVSKMSPPYQSLNLPQMEVWKKLGLRYRDALLENGHEQCSKWPYAFGQFDDGTPINLKMRRHYYEQVVSKQAGTESPFSRPADFKHLTT